MFVHSLMDVPLQGLIPPAYLWLPSTHVYCAVPTPAFPFAYGELMFAQSGAYIAQQHMRWALVPCNVRVG